MLRMGASKVVGWGMGTCWFGIKLTFSVRAGIRGRTPISWRKYKLVSI